MLNLSAKIKDKDFKRKIKPSEALEIIPAVLYGPKIKNLNLQVDLKEFESIYKEAGETSLITLLVEGQKEKFSVLIHEVQFNPLSGKPIHVDFYQPSLKEEIEATVPIVTTGESLAVKNLGGTLIKNISEIEVKALPQNLPKEIKVSIENLKSFEDNILVGDLQFPEGLKVLRESTDILVSVARPEKIEEELEKPIEEKVEEIEKVEEKKEEKPEKEEKEKKEKKETK